MTSKGDHVILDASIEKYLDLNLKVLSYIGVNLNISDSQDNKRKFREKIPVLIIISLQVYCAIAQILSIREAIGKHEYVPAAQISCDLFSNILISSKGCKLFIDVTEVESLLRELASLWRKYIRSPNIRKSRILRKADNALLICKFFVAFTICGIPIYGLTSFLNVISIYMHQNAASNYTPNYDKRVFFMKYPFAVNNPTTYCFVIFEEEYLLFGTAWFWLCADTLFAQILTHTSLQFNMLSDEMQCLMNKRLPEDSLKKQFAVLIERHEYLLRICARIEDIFSSVTLITMVLSSLNICFNLFAAMEMSNVGRHKDAIVNGYLGINTLMEIAFYCVFAEALTEQTRAVGDAIYNSQWTEKDSQLSIYVKMLITKSQNPFYCTAYGYFPIGHTRLTKILNAALSYLMMLRATT